MLSPLRRITLYWLLLLVPTLAIGGGAIVLLSREHARLAERSAEADEARRAAMAARARLIVENIELLVGDVQLGLLDTLVAEPAEGLEEFMERWENDNPLVRTAFLAAADGRLLRPNPRSADEEGRGFVRRFTRQFGGDAPWGLAASGTKSEKVSPTLSKRQLDEAEARKEVDSNVFMAQSARRDVQELVKAPVYSNSASSSRQTPETASEAAPSVAGVGSSSSSFLRGRSATDAGKASRGQALSDVAPDGRPAATPVRTKDIVPDKRGWLPWTVDGRMHLLGWVQPGGSGEVRGVELEMAALVARLDGVLPSETGVGEGYALRDDQGRVLHQVGSVPVTGGMRDGQKLPEPAFRVPLAPALLPDWDVVGYLALPYSSRGGDTGIIWTAAMLVVIFILAILLGGSLLLWQARRSVEEAAQKTSFVANVSHEFKTPLTTIRLYSELLEQGRVRDAAQGGEYLRTIGRETQRLARLVNNALDFSRLEQGRKKYARESVDLGSELGRLLDTHAPRLADAGLVLQRDLPKAPLIVTTDRDALEQIVLNLLDNACKYANGGGDVTVSVAKRENGGAVVRVGDRGPGVPAEHRERIFEKFHRVDDKLTAEKTGAGLGLSIARQLARGLGGELRCIERAGGGAEFILELP